MMPSVETRENLDDFATLTSLTLVGNLAPDLAPVGPHAAHCGRSKPEVPPPDGMTQPSGTYVIYQSPKGT
jgi:hypothetical protein